MKDYKGAARVMCYASTNWQDKNTQIECIYFQAEDSDPERCRFHEECDYGCVAFCNHKLEYGRK